MWDRQVSDEDFAGALELSDLAAGASVDPESAFFESFFDDVDDSLGAFPFEE